MAENERRKNEGMERRKLKAEIQEKEERNKWYFFWAFFQSSLNRLLESISLGWTIRHLLA